MVQFSYIVMRDDSAPATGEHHAYQDAQAPLKIERQIYADKGGELAHFLALVGQSEKPINTSDITLKTVGSVDPQLDALDFHWAKLKEEVEEITEQANYYHFAKTGKTNSAAADGFAHHTLITMSGHLLSQEKLEDRLQEGEVDEHDYPITRISQRLDAMREVAEHSDIKLDAFEKAIDRLSTRTYEAADRFDDILNGYSEGDDAQEEQEEPDWSTVDEEELAEGEWEEMTEEEIDAIEDEGMETGGTATEKREPWQDEDYDNDDERDENLRAEMDDYVNYMKDFTDAANQLWMNAATRVTDGGHVERERERIEEMKTIMQHTQEAYDIFKAHAEDLGTSAYEMKAVFERLEDPQKGTQAMMQRIISMASRPKHLEEAIKKALPKQRGME